jgi:hypothetical protein
VAENMTAGEFPPKPGIVDIVPVETVEPLIERHERELKALRLELDDALRQAEAAEQRLNVHPAASVFDDEFEVKVLASVERSISSVRSGGGNEAHPVIETRPPPPPPPTVSSAEVRTAPDSSEHVGEPRIVEPTVVEPTVVVPRPSADPSSTRPRTVVVDRGAPRTVVVDRGRAPAAPAPPPPPTTTPPTSVYAADPGAEQFINAQANKESNVGAGQNGTVGDRKSTRKGKAGHSSRLPARLLIQAGVIIVIVALLLLKLG